MTDPVTITASTIATLALQKFIESGAGELAKKFSTDAIAKMEALRRRIWAKLSGKPRIEEIKASIEWAKRNMDSWLKPFANSPLKSYGNLTLPATWLTS